MHKKTCEKDQNRKPNGRKSVVAVLLIASGMFLVTAIALYAGGDSSLPGTEAHETRIYTASVPDDEELDTDESDIYVSVPKDVIESASKSADTSGQSTSSSETVSAKEEFATSSNVARAGSNTSGNTENTSGSTTNTAGPAYTNRGNTAADANRSSQGTSPKVITIYDHVSSQHTSGGNTTGNASNSGDTYIIYVIRDAASDGDAESYVRDILDLPSDADVRVVERVSDDTSVSGENTAVFTDAESSSSIVKLFDGTGTNTSTQKSSSGSYASSAESKPLGKPYVTVGGYYNEHSESGNVTVSFPNRETTDAEDITWYIETTGGTGSIVRNGKASTTFQMENAASGKIWAHVTFKDGSETDSAKLAVTKSGSGHMVVTEDS